MKTLKCQNIWLRWAMTIPLFVFLIWIQGELFDWNYLAGIMLMILGIYTEANITKHLKYYEYDLTYEENDSIISLKRKEKEYQILNPNSLSYLPHNAFGFHYAMMIIKGPGYNWRFYSTNESIEQMKMLCLKLVAMNPDLERERDIWGNPVDMWKTSSDTEDNTEITNL